MHVSYAVADAIDVAARIFPVRRVVDRVRARVLDGRDLRGITALVGLALVGSRPRAKLYLARGVEVPESRFRAWIVELAEWMCLPPPDLPGVGSCDVIAVESEFRPAAGEHGIGLKAYLTFDSPDLPEGLLRDAGDLDRVRVLWQAGARSQGRCSLMVTVKGGVATAAQVAVRPDGLDGLDFLLPAVPPGCRPTYVGLELGSAGTAWTTYWVVPGRPLDPPAPHPSAPAVSPPRAEPKAIDISIGESCNNHCTFCINPTESWAPLASTEALEAVIARCARDGYRRMSFLGGEPTIHPELPRIVAFAYAQGFEEVMLISNGRRLADRAYADQLATAGIRRILFLFLSHQPAVHDAITRKSGSFAEALLGLASAQAAGIEACANIPITASNVDHLPEIGEFLVDRGVRALAYLYLAAYGNVLSNVGVMSDYDVTARSLAQVCDRLGDRVTLHIDNFPFCLLPGRERFILGEMANPWREIAYPSGGVVDVSHVYRFRKKRLLQCDGCQFDAACGGLQDLSAVTEIAREMAAARRALPG